MEKLKEAGSLDLGLHELVETELGRIDARAINSLPIGHDENGEEVIARVGRYGAYLQRGEENASIPEDMAPDELTLEKAIEFLSAPSGDRHLGEHPETGLAVYAKNGRFGAYIQMGELEKGSKEKPVTSSLMKAQEPTTITLEDALKLLSLPRLVGTDPADGKDIFAQLGRYGPYINKEKDSRSLEEEEQIFTLTVEEAQKIFEQPRRRGVRKVAEPLRELGKDPVSEELITLREGRFGLYVTDGETNASLRKEDDPKTLTQERAEELLQIRREAAPSKKKAKKKATKKKVTKKKATAKKATAKKATAKKATAKKVTKKKATAKKATKKKATAKKATTKKES